MHRVRITKDQGKSKGGGIALSNEYTSVSSAIPKVHGTSKKKKKNGVLNQIQGSKKKKFYFVNQPPARLKKVGEQRRGKKMVLRCDMTEVIIILHLKCFSSDFPPFKEEKVEINCPVGDRKMKQGYLELLTKLLTRTNKGADR